MKRNKALLAEKEKKQEMRDEIFKPAYWRKLHNKRNNLKSEEISRTINNQEPLQTYVDQNINTIVEKVVENKQETETKIDSPKPIPKKSITMPRSKPKTASSIQQKQHKNIKIKKVNPMRLEN